MTITIWEVWWTEDLRFRDNRLLLYSLVVGGFPSSWHNPPSMIVIQMTASDRNFNTAELISPVCMVKYHSHGQVQRLCSAAKFVSTLQRHSLRLKLQNSYNMTTVAPYTQDGLIPRPHFLHPGLVNCLFHFHLSALEWWSTAWFKAWHDQSLHPTLRDNDQLKAAQIGYLRGCMFTRAFLNSQSSGHDITLTIFEPKWLGSVPDYLSVRQKVV